MTAGKHFLACTTAALPAPPRSPIRSGMTKRETPFAGGWGVRVLLQRHPADKVVDEVRCHSEFDESEEKVKAQTPLLFVCFHGVLSFCCSLQRQRYGGDLPGFDKEKRFAGRCRRMTCGSEDARGSRLEVLLV